MDCNITLANKNILTVKPPGKQTHKKHHAEKNESGCQEGVRFVCGHLVPPTVLIKSVKPSPLSIPQAALYPLNYFGRKST